MNFIETAYNKTAKFVICITKTSCNQ